MGSSAVTVIQLHSIVAHLQECYSFECLSGMTMGFIRSSSSTSSPGSEQMRASGGFLAPGMEYGNNCILKDVTGTNIHSILRSSALVHLSVWLAGCPSVCLSLGVTLPPPLSSSITIYRRGWGRGGGRGRAYTYISRAVHLWALALCHTSAVPFVRIILQFVFESTTVLCR